MLNYAYDFLESECRAAINTVGLEPSVGFLHEPCSYQTKQSLVHDLQEPFHWVADVTVMDAFESGMLDLPDFYFMGDDYRYRLEPEAKGRFLELLRERFNSGITYKGRALKWITVIEQKTVELGTYLVGRNDRLDFSEPSPNLHGTDERELRKRILGLSQEEAQRLGSGKSTLHYLRKRAKKGPMLKTHSTVTRRLIADVSQAPRLAQKSLKGSALIGDAVASNAKSCS